jgi:hypothetical protein
VCIPVISFEKVQRRLETLDCRHPGVRPFGAQPGLDQPPLRSGIAGLPEVVCDLVGVGPGRLFQGLADPPVPPLPERWQQLPVECLANQGVDEAQLLAVGRLLYQVRLQDAPDRFSQLVIARVAHRLPQAEGHLLAGHRRDRQQPPRLLVQLLQPAFYDLAQQRRYPDAAWIFERPAFTCPVQDKLLFQRSQKLYGKERIPLGVIRQVGHQPPFVGRGQRIAGGHQLLDRPLAQPPQLDSVRSRLTHQRWQEPVEGPPPGHFIVPVGNHEQHAKPGQIPRHETQQLQAGRVSPVQVFEYEYQRILPHDSRQKFVKLLEERGLTARCPGSFIFTEHRGRWNILGTLIEDSTIHPGPVRRRRG